MAKKEDRLFVRDGRRNYRRRHSLQEVRIGVLLLLGLGLVAIWVIWKGANPDPALFEVPVSTLDPGKPQVDRGPLPGQLAAAGWHEGELSQFDVSNLYEKINGREDFYKSFGFERLYSLSLIDDEDPATVVDIEFFDLGAAENALGAYAGERPPEISPVVAENGMSHLARNALFISSGRYYVRAIGADESARVQAQLAHLRQVFAAALTGEPLPWAYALFVGQMGIDPSRVSYMAENAFSFGFAQNVYSALLEDDETEIFIVVESSEDAAEQLAARFAAGFLEYGSAAESSGGVEWSKDRYLNAISGVLADGRWVTGVRGAPDVQYAEAALSSFRQGVQALPETVIQQAHSTRSPAKAAQTLANPEYPDEN